MRHLENDSRTLESLLIDIKSHNDMQQDFIAPTNQLQFKTIENDKGVKTSQIIMEADRGEKTQILNANQVCLDQIANKIEIQAPTFRRLLNEVPQ